MDAERKPWEQQEAEPTEAYVRFLIYRNLGPARSVERAYEVYCASGEKAEKGRKSRTRISGQWNRDSSQYSWRERAAKWDAAQLASAVPETATTIFALIAETARAGLAELLSGRIRPRNWKQLQEMVVILAGFISPEVITATIDHADHPASTASGANDGGTGARPTNGGAATGSDAVGAGTS